MEDIKQNIKDNEYKIIMDSLMEIRKEKEKNETLYYTQKEFDEMTKVMIKLSLDIFFEYTNEENDMIWFDTIKRFTEDKLNFYKIGFRDGIETHILKIFEEKKI